MAKRGSLVWALAAVALGLWACSGEPEKKPSAPDGPLTLPKLLQELSTELKYDPGNPLLLYRRSQVHHSLGNTLQALADVELALQADSSNAAYWTMRGFYAYTLGRDSLAAHSLDRALALNDSLPEAWHLRGNVEVLMNRPRQALGFYDRALALAPDSAVYWLGKAHAQRQLKQTAEAEKSLKRALQCDSLQPQVLSEQVLLHLLDLNDLNRAAQYNLKLLKHHPRLPVGYYNQGMISFRSWLGSSAADSAGRRALLLHAQNAYSKALDLDSNMAQAWYDRGYVRNELGRYAQALSDFAQAVRKNPRDARSQFMLAALYEHFNETDSARSHYERALQLKPGWPEARQALQELPPRKP